MPESKRPLLPKLLAAIRREDATAALELLKEIEARKYPESIRRIAELHINNNPTLKERAANQYVLAFSKALRYFLDKNHQEPAFGLWIPLQLIAIEDMELANTLRRKSTCNDLLATASTTVRPLEIIRRINSDPILVRSMISDFIDDDWYKRIHPDMKGADREIALIHYSTHGGKEADRSPNPVFRNSEFFAFYPWCRDLSINPLFACIAWPSQFTEYIRVLEKRSRYVLEAGVFDPEIQFARATPKQRNPTDYDRVLSLTKEYTGSSIVMKSDPGRLRIHIVIPEFTKGSGGHMTIFRMVRHLEEFGHQVTVWVKDFKYSNHPLGPTQTALRFYQQISAQVLPLSSHFAFSNGDALLATSWDTVELVCAHQGFIEKFYLVQDYEPYFYARGAESLKAELTYHQDIKTICASRWLHEIMASKFGKKSTYFDLSYNADFYFVNKRRNFTAASTAKKVVKIAFYARTRTPRRAVQLALDALKRVNTRDNIFMIEMFGDDQDFHSLPSNVIGRIHGILSSEELGSLYRECDLGLTFSATNYALVPQEMMACGLPVIEIDNDSTRAIYPDNVVTFAQASSSSIANAIEELAFSAQKRVLQAKNALEWVRSTSWDKSFRRVEEFISSCVSEKMNIVKHYDSYRDGYLSLPWCRISGRSPKNTVVSVVIPVYNGGVLLREVCDRVLQQEINASFELVIIDSQSTDGSIDMLPVNDRITVYQITKNTFQHGRTRNLGAALTSSPYVAFLTQDALPSNNSWLKHLIEPLIANSDIVAAFGKHIKHDHHPDYLSRELLDCFDRFGVQQKLFNKNSCLRRYYSEDPSTRQSLHFYSDNNSCLRREAWERFPYPDIEYGEDQMWADRIIQHGLTKAYCPDAIVHHSHNYDFEEEFERKATEAYFYMKFFGYNLSQTREKIEKSIEGLVRGSESTGQADSWKQRIGMARSMHEGYLNGVDNYFNTTQL